MIYLLALAAGFAMNFMPCVLPVIGLKLSAFRHQKVPYIFGVFVSFMILATLAVVTGAGLAHMSYEWFRMILAAVCFLMGSKLLGWWQWNVRIPGVLGEFGGPFGTGLMTVALGSSCSVPFLAPALAYCASAGALATYGIFAAMCFGFVSPFLLPIPMPNVGKWSVWFERGCGAALLLVGGWLCLTLPGASAVAAIAAVFMVLWLISVIQMKPETVVVSSIFVLPMIVVLAISMWYGPSEPPAGISIPIAGNRAVIVTADWCINCQIVKRVWESKPVRARLKELGIRPVVLDWTNRDQRVTAFLRRYDHQSVPFALIEVGGRVTVLSGIYTSRDALEALKWRN